MNEKTAHTPGKWEALSWEVDNGGTDWNVWGPKPSNHIGNPNLQGDYGSEADARLLAAAPDLLVAVQRCLNFIEATEAEWGEEFECGKIARNAVSKATGAAP